MRARKPDVLLRLRLVPSRVRLVMNLLQWDHQQKVTVYNLTANSSAVGELAVGEGVDRAISDAYKIRMEKTENSKLSIPNRKSAELPSSTVRQC